MFKVLHIMTGDDFGGIASVVTNYYDYIDKEKFHFDFAFTTNVSGELSKKYESMGAKIYELPLKSKGIKKFSDALSEILKNTKYDAVHVHESSTSFIALAVAKKAGVKKRIAHSHTSAPFVSLKGEIRRLLGCVLNYHYATNVIGCGKLAGERIFGKINMKRKKALVLPNAVDTKKFAFKQEERNEIREKLGIEDKYVLGMVGRLAPEKNYLYAIWILNKIKTIIPETILLIAGNGEEKNKIIEAIQKSKLSESVMLLGKRNDVERLYQAFDVFMLPSVHEGFPVSAVEAMASGLPVLLSSNITDELSFGSRVKYINLGDDEGWIEAIANAKKYVGRDTGHSEVKNAGFDIVDASKILEDVYLKKR